jgi:hypothetical protein
MSGQTRRQMLASTAGALLLMQARGLLQEATEVTEHYHGDPDLPTEAVSFQPAAIRHLSEVTTTGRATFKPWDPKLPQSMLATARNFIGHSRTKTPDAITEMLRLFGLPLKDAQGKYVAYCAAGLSFAAIAAFTERVDPGFDPTKKIEVYRTLAPEIEHYYFYPTVSCIDMMFGAKAKRRWVPRDQVAADKLPQPGWVVLFDWTGRGTPNHCGIVQSATAKNVFTVEFNTSSTDAGSQRDGGTVADRTRGYDHILGFIKTTLKPGLI